MSRHLSSPFRCLAIVFVIAAISVSNTARAQDIGDIDMFGDQQTDTPPTTQDDPLNLDDFGTPDLGAETDPIQPEQRTFEQALAEGMALAEGGKLGEAIQTFNEILTLGNPNYAPASLELGKAYVELGELGLASQAFENARNTGAQFPGVVLEATIAQGNVFMEQQLYQEAIDAFSAAVSVNPLDANALMMRGKAQIRSATSFAAGPGAAELISSAVDSLDRAIEIDEGFVEAYVERARANLLLRKFDQAIADADKSLELDSSSPDTIARRAFAYFSRGGNERNRHDADLDAAISDLQVAVNGFNDYLAIEGDKAKEDYDDAAPDTIRPDQILASKAEAQIVIGNEAGPGQSASYYNQAIEDANRLIEYDSDAAAGYYHRGVAQRMLGDLRAAVESWSKALEVSPDNPEFLLRRGIAWYYLGENRLARRDFEAAEVGLQLGLDGRALFWSGVTYANEGDFAEAVRLYTGSLRFAPNFKPAYNNRGLAYMRLGEYARANADFAELVRRDPDDSLARQRRDEAKRLMDAERSQMRESIYYP